MTNRSNTESVYLINCDKKQTTYWEGYKEAQRVRQYLITQGLAPTECRIVGFQRGYAIQERISGAYWFMPAGAFV